MHKPLISCVMPTSGRKWFIQLAIYYFETQDYPHKELIIVYNNPTDIPDHIQVAENVKLVQSSSASIGAKRNEGCRHACGTIIAQWDDDDIYHHERLSIQAAPLITGVADISALQGILFYEHDSGKCWSCTDYLFAILFAQQVVGGTLMFQKNVWDRLVQYPNFSMREDAEFLIRAMHRGARLKRIAGKNLFLYRRHIKNTWRFSSALQIQQPGWKEENLPEWVNKCPQSLTKKNTGEEVIPFVSCIMPTANRKEFVTRSIEYFLQQDYPNKELIILDDGSQAISSVVPFHPMIRYVFKEHKTNIGAKRNEACRLSKGDIIMHWDDDDWYAPDWISRQVEFMQTTKADITGLDQVIFYQSAAAKAWKYIYPSNAPLWVAGATMGYRKSIWEAHPFEDVQVGEDNWFVWKAGGKVIPHTYLYGFVSNIHPGNTSPKHVNSQRWIDFPVASVMKLLDGSNII